jgi:hypothetical protein
MSLALRKIDPQEMTEMEKVKGFFLSAVWRDSAESGYEVHGVYRNSSPLPIALLSTFSYKKLGKSLLITPPMAPHCGFEILNIPENAVKRQSTTKQILRTVADKFHDSKAYIDLAFPYDAVDMQPFKECDFEIEVGYTFLLDLDLKSEDDLLSGMTSERRKNLRDGRSLNLSTRLNPPVDDVVSLVNQTLSGQGVTSHDKTLRNLLKANSHQIFSIGVFDGDQMTATAIIGMDARRAHYLAGGTQKTSAAAGPLSLWEAIKESKKRGAKEFDFLGSSVPAIERYFRAFGGELTPYFRIRRNTALVDFLKSTKERFH